ncbi:MAG: aspartate aminotransferase family protein [Firmicutes bacterium]|nr:aspartate aminotransferase family protein [Bacillota bacterium]
MEHVLWSIGHDLIIENIVKAQGCYLYDSGGRRYVDFESGVWCTPLGHSHPRVNRVVKAQVDHISHTGYCYAHPATEEAAKEILEITGLPGGKCVFLSSGSEAVEFGVQVLRKISGKPRLLTLVDSFLGSYGSAGKKRGEEWHLLDWSLCSTCSRPDKCTPQCRVFGDIPCEEIGGFVFEPGNSSGQVRFPPVAFIKNLVHLISKNNGFVQANEITTGMGRTGEWFGFQHYSIQPDIVSMGKGLGNGYPVSSIAMSPGIIDRLNESSFYYSQSHINDPLGCSAARAVIQVLKEDNLVERSKRLGEILIKRLTEICGNHDFIKEVRGRGLMIAIEFLPEHDTVPAAQIYRAMLNRGFIIARRPGRNTLRVDPPLNVDENDIEEFLYNFNQVLHGI